MNWQGHEVWIQALLPLVGQQGSGEGRPEGHGSYQLPHLLLGWWENVHPVPGRVTAEMGLFQCINPSFQVGRPMVSFSCGEEGLPRNGCVFWK